MAAFYVRTGSPSPQPKNRHWNGPDMTVLTCCFVNVILVWIMIMQCTFKQNSMKVSLHSNDVSLWVIITKTNNHFISFYRSLEFPAGEKLLANYQVQNSFYNLTELLFIKLKSCSFWLRVINESNRLNGLNVSQNLIHNDTLMLHSGPEYVRFFISSEL